MNRSIAFILATSGISSILSFFWQWLCLCIYFWPLENVPLSQDRWWSLYFWLTPPSSPLVALPPSSTTDSKRIINTQENSALGFPKCVSWNVFFKMGFQKWGFPKWGFPKWGFPKWGFLKCFFWNKNVHYKLPQDCLWKYHHCPSNDFKHQRSSRFLQVTQAHSFYGQVVRSKNVQKNV